MFTKKFVSTITPPALLLDLDALDDNSREIAHHANGKKIRIATKSIRSVPVLKRILDSNSIFQGVMTFSPHEAIFLAGKGFDDILMGYPCWDEEALIQIAQLSETKVILMIDSMDHIDYLAKIAEETSGKFLLCIDIDMSTSYGSLHFGVRRSPIHNELDALQVAEKIRQSPRLELVGIMGYEAQIAGVGDQVPTQLLKNKLISFLKKRSIREIEARRRAIIEALLEKGHELPLINGGGTGSLHTTTTEEYVTEVTVGSGFYSPLLFDYYKDFRYKPALYFALPIVRKPTAQIHTCLGGGYIASGAVGKDKEPKPIFPPGGKLLPLEGAGEVQTPVFYEQENLQIGDAIIFRAAKAGEICERFNEIICFSKEEIVAHYQTYRGEGVCFL